MINNCSSTYLKFLQMTHDLKHAIEHSHINTAWQHVCNIFGKTLNTQCVRITNNTHTPEPNAHTRILTHTYTLPVIQAAVHVFP